MAHLNTSKSLVKRSADDVALMPPPPVKRIRRPSTVLDEDDYTSALSDIIARDYFPGLRESRAQQEYLAALDSNDPTWIADAGLKLRQLMTPKNDGKRRSQRNKAFDRPNTEPNPKRAADTPHGNDGSQTPSAASDVTFNEAEQPTKALDTTTLSLSSFQSTYTSEDNASFNTVLDKQNQKRREKHAYMWTEDQRIPSARQIVYRAQEQRFLKQREEEQANADADGKALISLSAGATIERPARPDGWKMKKPDNTFMFFPSSVDEDGVTTVQEMKEANSKAAKKEIVHENTRFPPLQYVKDAPVGQIPPSPSLNTEIIAQRDVARERRSASVSGSEYPGGETPRVNGYAFVDEDEPTVLSTSATNINEPSYRDLLAGQVGDSTPNPFSISIMKKREAIHHRMVEETASKKRDKDKETMKGMDGNTSGIQSIGNMTPAAKKLMDKLGRTPVQTRSERMSSTEMWTPRDTPRRRAVK